MRLSEDEQKLVGYLSNLTRIQKLIAILYYFAFVPPVAILTNTFVEWAGFTEFLDAGSYGLYFFLVTMTALLILLPIIIVMLWMMLILVSISEFEAVPNRSIKIQEFILANNDVFAPAGQTAFHSLQGQPQLVWAFRPTASRSATNPSLAAFAVPTPQFMPQRFSINHRHSAAFSDFSRLFIGGEVLLPPQLSGVG